MAEKRFNLDLKAIECVPDIFGLSRKKIDFVEDNILSALHSQTLPHKKLFQKIKENLKKFKILSQYDLIFYLSDGSVPFLFSKNNFLHIQVPFVTKEKIKDRVLNLIKTKQIKQVVCNSQFTSKFLENFPKNKLSVLYPPVDVDNFSAAEHKENIILSVGRFDNILNAKKQDVLIEAFKHIYQNNPSTNWKLILMGGSHDLPENNHYLQHLQFLAKDLPIEFVVNPDFDKLRQIYSNSKIYWHAAGFGVDEYLHPEETEHFGMTVVEAMASALVPIVVAKGGLTEIVTDSKNGYLWQNIDELVAKTQLLLGSPQTLKELSVKALESSRSFSKQVFEEKLLNLIKK